MSRQPDDAALDLGREISAAARAARTEIGWSQREVARRLRVSQSMVSRLEAGRLHSLDLDLASRLLQTLGIRVILDGRSLGVTNRAEQRDLVHATCSGFMARRLSRLGWLVATEVEVGRDRYRGWIDVLACRPSDGTLLVIEITTRLIDAGALLRTLNWYTRVAPIAARRLGWQPRRVIPALILLASAENDLAIAVNRSLLRESLPSGGGALGDLIANGGGRVPRGAVAMIDPQSRRRVWLRATRSDGRWTAAPCANYADAAQAIRPRR